MGQKGNTEMEGLDLVQLAMGGGLSAVGLLLLRFWREKRTDKTTETQEWRLLNNERKSEIEELRRRNLALETEVMDLKRREIELLRRLNELEVASKVARGDL